MNVDFDNNSIEHKKILSKICPNCCGNLKEYASGGLSLNLECQDCHSCFADYFAFGSERIPNPFQKSV